MIDLREWKRVARAAITWVLSNGMLPPVAIKIVLVGVRGSSIGTWIEALAVIFFAAMWAAMAAAEAERAGYERESNRMAKFLIGLTGNPGGEFTFIIEHRDKQEENPSERDHD